jgi:glycerol-1-phosphatase
VPEQRPTYIGDDLRSLHRDADTLAVTAQPAWHVDAADGSLTVSAARADETGDDLSIVRAVANAVWSGHLDGQSVTVKAGDDTAHGALQKWSLA